MTPEESALIERVIEILAVVPVDSKIARMAGFLRRSYTLKLPDSVIAATSLFTGSTLITRNIQDFKKIPNLKLLKI